MKREEGFVWACKNVPMTETCSQTLLHKVGGRKGQCLCTQHKHTHLPTYTVVHCICHTTLHSIPFFPFPPLLSPSLSMPPEIGSLCMMTSVLVCPDGRPLCRRHPMAQSPVTTGFTRRVERSPPTPSVRGRGQGTSTVVVLCHDPLLVAHHRPHGCIIVGSNR